MCSAYLKSFVSLLAGGLMFSTVLPLNAQAPRKQTSRPPQGPSSRGAEWIRPAEGGSGSRSTVSGSERNGDLQKGTRRSIGTTGSPSGSLSSGAGAPLAIYRPIRQYTPPDRFWWADHDIMAEIRWIARRGYLPVTPVAEGISELNGTADFPSGFKAYGFVVPAGAKLHVRLHHSNEGWFRVAMVNKWGDLGAGMLQNRIPTGNPEVSYTNPGKEAQAVYVLVDDPGWMSSTAYPYTLEVQRDWEPGKADTKGAKVVEGIWASNPVAESAAEFASPHTRAAFGMGRRW